MICHWINQNQEEIWEKRAQRLGRIVHLTFGVSASAVSVILFLPQVSVVQQGVSMGSYEKCIDKIKMMFYGHDG
jgi:hypothetical protein